MNSDIGTYMIHDNYDRPFVVAVEARDINHYSPKRKVTVYRNGETTTPLLEFKADEVFIGKSHPNRMTQFSGGYGDFFDGNTILIRKADEPLKYVYIGSCIKEFDTYFSIVKYESPVGNNDVPYPFAIDKAGYIYLVEYANVILTPPHRLEIDMNDPYDYYHLASCMTADCSFVPPRMPIFPDHQGVCEFWMQSERWTMHYKSYPEEEYDRLTKCHGKIHFVMTDGTAVPVDKKRYADLMRSFGREHNFEPLRYTMIIARGL